MPEDRLTEEDICMLKCYHEKGDITAWVGWEQKQAQIQAQFPELVTAVQRVEVAERTLQAVLNNLEV